MEFFKCKMCGGELDYKEGSLVCECLYCGTKQTLPRLINDEKIASLYNIANSYRMANEFDKAINLYNQIIIENPTDCDAYWNIVLCNFGVVYVEDPSTKKRIPTCNRTQPYSILDDKNYQKAISLADVERKEIIEADAEYINTVQQKILSIAKKESPYDIFICYKETNENRKRSKDSIKAQEVYEKLTDLGYKVFFSRITLEKKAGTEYEPYIYAALYSSKVMLHITSSGAVSNAVWVKNEWSRYLSLCQQDVTKHFVPIYFDCKKSELPEEFANIPSYDYTEEGFEQELIRSIKKLIPTPVMKLKQRKKRRKIIATVVAVLVVAFLGIGASYIPKYLEYKETKPKYDAAMQLYYDQKYKDSYEAFSTLGDFEDSKDMAEQSVLSWRKVLANTIQNPNRENNTPYISKNGTLNEFSSVNYGEKSQYTKDINLDEHGSIISEQICTVDNVAVFLHEDGYISNLEKYYDVKDANIWTNIIKIKMMWGSDFLIALKTDGTLLVASSKKIECSTKETKQIINNITSLKDILDFKICEYEYTVDDTIPVFVALNKDGNLEAVCPGSLLDEPLDDVNLSAVKDFSDIVSFDIGVSNIVLNDGYWTENGLEGSKDEYVLNIAALNKNGKVLVSYQKETGRAEETEENVIVKEYDKKNALEVLFHYNDYDEVVVLCLLDNGDVIDVSTDNSILHNVAKINEEYIFISKTGAVSFYSYDEECYTSQDIGTIVYDEWSERIK